jgi:hypothetical protein
MVAAIHPIARVFWLFGYDATITEANDTIERSWDSKHKRNPVEALDWRTWYNGEGGQMPASLKERIAEEIERECPKVKAVAKKTHIHTELR